LKKFRHSGVKQKQSEGDKAVKQSSVNTVRLQFVSRRFRILFQVLMILVPLINGVFWLAANHLPDVVQRECLPYADIFPLPWTTLLMGFVVTMLPVGVGMYGIYCLTRLFSLYEKGKIFLAGNVYWYKRLSLVLLWSCGAGIICRCLLSIVLSLHNPPGQRKIALSLSSDDVNLLLLGGILAVIAWVMDEGRKLQEEADLTV
jgi:hypothetical protein